MARSSSSSRAAQAAQETFWEWARANPLDYIESFLFVVDKNAQQVKFKFNVQQAILMAIYLEESRNSIPHRWAVNKYRQPGISKGMGAIVHARTVPFPNHNSQITAHRKKVAEKNLRLQKQHIANLPQALRPMVDVSNKEEVYLADRNSTISCNSANDPAAARGDTVNTWILTEYCYYQEQGASLDEVLDAGMQQVPDKPDTMIVAESTSNGTADKSYDFYQAAKKTRPGQDHGENGFRAIFLYWKNDPACQRPFHGDRRLEKDCPWYDHPEAKTWEEARAKRNSCALCRKERYKWSDVFLTKKLRERQIKYGLDLEQIHWYWHTLNRRLRGDELKMQQEYPCDDYESFIASGTPLFDGDTIKRVKEHCVKGKLYDVPMEAVAFEDLTPNDQLVRNQQEYLEIWEPPRPGKVYVVAADSSMGNAKGNPSAAYIVEMDSMDVVAALHGWFDPDLYGEILTFIGYLYNTAIVAAEVENTGHAALAALSRLNYPNLYVRYNLTPEGWIQGNQLGWSTNNKTKPQMVAVGRKLFTQLVDRPKAIALKVKDPELLDELGKFTTGHLSKRGFGAQLGANDDRPMAWFISQMVCHQELGIDIGEAASVNKDAAHAKEYEHDRDKRLIIKSNNLPYSEHKRLMALYEKGYEIDDLDESGQVCVNDFNSDWDYED